MTASATDLPIGAEVTGWTERPRPPRTPLDGRSCRLEPLDPVRHAADLFSAYREDAEDALWTYLPYGPFASEEAYVDWAKAAALAESDVYFAIIDRESGRALGVSGYLRVDPANGSIEVGNIAYAPALQRSVAGTEAQYLLMRRAFDELGYRRYEWKCNDLNAPSRRAAERYGFSYEGTFRQASVVKGRNRDTAWFSILDSEWPAIRAGFEAWLDPVNFKEGIQIGRLSQLIEANR